MKGINHSVTSARDLRQGNLEVLQDLNAKSESQITAGRN